VAVVKYPASTTVLSVYLHGPETIIVLGQSMVTLYRETGQVDARTDDPLVVVRVHTNRVGFQVESVLAILDLLQLVLVKVGPSPDTSVDHVGKTLPPSHL